MKTPQEGKQNKPNKDTFQSKSTPVVQKTQDDTQDDIKFSRRVENPKQEKRANKDGWKSRREEEDRPKAAPSVLSVFTRRTRLPNGRYLNSAYTVTTRINDKGVTSAKASWHGVGEPTREMDYDHYESVLREHNRTR